MSRLAQSEQPDHFGPLRDAARLFFDAQRCLIAETICLDEAGLELDEGAVDALRTVATLSATVEGMAASLTSQEAAA